jgi:hypothetical protein
MLSLIAFIFLQPFTSDLFQNVGAGTPVAPPLQHNTRQKVAEIILKAADGHPGIEVPDKH